MISTLIQLEVRVQYGGSHPVRVEGSFGFGIEHDSIDRRQDFAIPAEDLALSFDQAIEAFELREPERRLEAGHLVLVGDLGVPKVAVAGGAAVIAQDLRPVEQLASLVASKPPSPVVSVFDPWKLKTLTRPRLPAGRPP